MEAPLCKNNYPLQKPCSHEEYEKKKKEKLEDERLEKEKLQDERLERYHREIRHGKIDRTQQMQMAEPLFLLTGAVL